MKKIEEVKQLDEKVEDEKEEIEINIQWKFIFSWK